MDSSDGDSFEEGDERWPPWIQLYLWIEGIHVWQSSGDAGIRFDCNVESLQSQGFSVQDGGRVFVPSRVLGAVKTFDFFVWRKGEKNRRILPDDVVGLLQRTPTDHGCESVSGFVYVQPEMLSQMMSVAASPRGTPSLALHIGTSRLVECPAEDRWTAQALTEDSKWVWEMKTSDRIEIVEFVFESEVSIRTGSKRIQATRKPHK